MDRSLSVSLELRTRVINAVKDASFCKEPDASNPFTFPEKYKSILNNINGFIGICNYTTGLYEYVSDSIQSHLGYDLKGYSSEELSNFIFSTIVHPQHGDFLLNRILPPIFQYFKENSTMVNGTDFRYTCCMKMKNIHDVYEWYLVDTVIIEVSDTGFPVRTLITCTNINQFKKDECIYYNIVKKNSDGVYEVMLEGVANNIKDDYKLTAREIEIINLIAQGNTNNQIAQKLFISLNTVQTHRKNILRKTKCNGTAELTNFAFVRGLL